MNNYYRITGYYEKEDFCFIIDSNGMFDKLWKFSSFLVCKEIEVLEVTKLENVIDINIEPSNEDKENLILRTTAKGKPEYITQTINGVIYKAIKVNDKIYIPDKIQIV